MRLESGELRKESDPKTATLPEREDADALTVVGLGGSAGSIPALEAFFQSVPEESTSAYVVVVHLSPEHESHLAEVLGRSSRIPIHQVTAPVKLKARHVYVIPPARQLEMQDGMLIPSAPVPRLGTRVAIDTFFRTLSESHGPQSAAVILSGSGADGALGIRQVKELGGLVVAQSPAEAEFDAMPRSAIATGVVDYVLPVLNMPAQIEVYWETSRRMRIPQEAVPSPEQRQEGADQESALHEILTHIRVQTGHDFTYYKRATVLRRIGRRMQVNRQESLPDYRDFLLTHPAEVNDLIGDLLISVTQFFRDAAAWQALERDVIPRLFDGKTASDEVRAWVCGSATGEEAYTLAMLLLERARQLPQAPRVLIFVTDMDGEAIVRARAGVYLETISNDVSEERLRNWFYRQDGSYQVRKELREAVLFAHHDVLRDTPFSRLDLVTCRNLFIYLNRDAQLRAFHTFHFGLRTDRYLLLGSAESAEGADDLFAPTDKQNRLYIRRPGRTLVPIPATRSLSVSTERLVMPAMPPAERASAPLAPAHVPPASSGRRALFLNALEQFGPPAALVNAAYDVVHLSRGLSRFLSLPGGEPTHNLLQLIHPALRLELRTTLFAAATQGVEQARIIPLAEGADGDGAEGSALPLATRLTVRPMAAHTGGAWDYFLVVLETLPVSELPAVLSTSADSGQFAEMSQGLEQENTALQEQLRATTEQYDAQAEELKSANEEMHVTNEEMRSVVEELETGKEELQSVNEELSTVNHELKVRVEELTAANSDFSNFISATDIATVFLDRALNVRRFTSAALTLFNLIPTDVGRPLADVTNRLNYPHLFDDAGQVLARLQAVEREVTTADGERHFQTRLLPYRSLDDRIEGVVVTFMDITERKRAEDIMRQSEERLQAAINIETVGVLFFNNEFEITDCNEAFVRMSGYTRKELKAGRFRWEVFTPDRYVEVSSRALTELNTSGISTPYEKEYLRKDGSRFWAVFAAKRISETEIVEFVTDITEQKRAEEVMRESEERLRLATEAGRLGTWEWHLQENEVYWNEWHFLLFGMQPRPNPMTPEEFFQHVHPDDRERVSGLLAKSIAEKVVFEADFRAVLMEGEIRWMSGYGRIVEETAGGAPRKMSGVMFDITERKDAQEALQAANAKLEQRVEERTHELSEMSALRQELLRKLVTAQEEERGRISRDLHDDTGQQLAVLLLALSSLRSHPALTDAPDALKTLEQSYTQAEEVARKSHRLSFTLRPTVLDDLGLLGALENYLEVWAGWSGVRIQMENVGFESGVRLPSELETTIYRVVQEALTNVLKHALEPDQAEGKRANRTTVLVQRTDESVVAIVEDDGPGFDVDAALSRPPRERRLGIFGMQERARLVGGMLEVESVIGEGTTVFLRLPLLPG